MDRKMLYTIRTNTIEMASIIIEMASYGIRTYEKLVEVPNVSEKSRWLAKLITACHSGTKADGLTLGVCFPASFALWSYGPCCNEGCPQCCSSVAGIDVYLAIP